MPARWHRNDAALKRIEVPCDARQDYSAFVLGRLQIEDIRIDGNDYRDKDQPGKCSPEILFHMPRALRVIGPT